MAVPEELKPTLSDFLYSCRVPRGIGKTLCEPLRETVATRVVDLWAATDQSILVLLGGVGCGKTVAACSALLGHWKERRGYLRVPGDLPPTKAWRSAMFVTLADLGSRSLWDGEDRDFRQQVIRTPMLIMDECGTEHGDGASAITELIRDRLANHRRTILTSNMTPAKFIERYGQRVHDRIKGDGRIDNVHGPSLRGEVYQPSSTSEVEPGAGKKDR